MSQKSQVGKALIAIGKALIPTQHNGHRTSVRYAVVRQPKPQKKRKAPFHWHLVWGRTKYVMDRVGYNQRTGRYVYQCPFCRGKAERPYAV
jgi:hypothetical protein